MTHKTASRRSRNAGTSEAVAAWFAGRTKPSGTYVLVGPGSATAADVADVETLLDLRIRLLSDANVQARCRELAAIRDDAEALRIAAESLSEDLDWHLGRHEIERIAMHIKRHGQLPPPGLVARTGSQRPRARRPIDKTVQLVAESLALRAAGMTSAEADETVAERLGHADGKECWRADIASRRTRLKRNAKRLRRQAEKLAPGDRGGRFDAT